MLGVVCVLSLMVPGPVAHQVIQGVSAPVDAMAVSSDGYLASAHTDGSIRIWRLDTRTLIRWIPASQVPAHDHPVEMTWDESSHELLLAADPNGVVAIDLEGHAVTRAMPDGQELDRLRLAGGSRLAGALGRWRLEDPHGAKLADIGVFGDVVLSSDGKYALGADRSGLTLFTVPKLAHRPPIATSPAPSSAGIDQRTGLAIANDGSTAAACLGAWPANPKVVVIDRLSSHPVVHAVALDFTACSVAIPADHSIALVADVGWLAGVDIATGRVRWLFPIGYAMNGTRIELAVWGRIALASLPDGTIRLLDVVHGEPLGELGYGLPTPVSAWFAPGDQLVVRTMSSAEGQRGVTAGADVLTTWDLSVGSVLSRANVDLHTAELADDGTLTVARYRAEAKGGCYSFAVGTLANGAPDGTPTPQWPPRPGQGSLECIGARTTVSAIDPTSGTIITHAQGQDAVIRPGKAPVTLANVGGGIMGMRLELGGGGRWVLGYHLRGELGTLFAWNSDTGLKRWFSAAPGDPEQATISIGGSAPARQGFTAYAMSADGAQLAVGGGDTVTVYEPAHKRVIRTVVVPGNVAVSAIAIAADGTLAIGTSEGTLAIARPGAQPVLVPSTGGEIQHIRYRGDGKRIVTISEDGGVRIWNPARGALAATLVAFADGEPLALTPAGAYAGRPEAAERVIWAFDAPTEGFRFERYAATFGRPDLVRARLGGGVDDLAAAVVRPPRVSFAKQPAARVTKSSLQVTAHAEANAGAISDIRAYVDGRLAATAHVGAASGDRDLTLELEQGVDVITLVAFDDGGRSSNPVSVEVDATRVRAPRPDIWIVAAGVGWYPDLDSDHQLDATVNDAEAIASAFKAQAGPGKAYRAAHVTLLEDEAVTREGLDGALRALSAMKPNDVAIVFLAGHGTKPPGSDEMVFLPSTTKPDPRTWAETGIGWSAIGGALAQARGRVLVLLDACQAGHMSTEMLVPNTELADRLVSSQRAGVFVFAASRGDQKSYEANRARGLELDDEQQAQLGQTPPRGKHAKLPPPPAPVTNVADPHAPRARHGHGYFTAAVLAALRLASSDTNRDGVIELSELVATVQARVTVASNGRQTPWVVRRELFGDYGVARTPAR